MRVWECAYLVPGLLSRGSAKHWSGAAHGVSWKVLPTHCANWPWTHACSPSVHGELAVRPWNCLFNACASSPFCSVNAARRVRPPVAPVAAMRASASAWVSHVVLCPNIQSQKGGSMPPVTRMGRERRVAGLRECTYLVPGLLSRGSAKHWRGAEHGVSWKVPPTHCANWPWTHACSPFVHGELAVRPWNFWFNACASFPFCSENAARRVRPPVAPMPAIRASASAWVSHAVLCTNIPSQQGIAYHPSPSPIIFRRESGNSGWR